MKGEALIPQSLLAPAFCCVAIGLTIYLIRHISLRDYASCSKDILGRCFEYFLKQFANAEGKKGGQFYTPRRIVHVRAQMLALHKGRVFDPCRGSGQILAHSFT